MLAALPVGATVGFQQPSGAWKLATVIGSAGTRRSYNIITDEGHVLQRNRCHLLQTSEGDTAQEVITHDHQVET